MNRKVFAAVIVLGLSCGTHPPAAAVHEPSYEIAFTEWPDAHAPARLAVRSLGAPQRSLRHDAAPHSAVSWSPDGQRLAFTRQVRGQSSIWTAAPDGGDVRQVTEPDVGDRDPAWSPRGDRIAFVRYARVVDEVVLSPVRSVIGVVDADGGESRTITDPLMLSAVLPSWSPDGKFIAFEAIPVGSATTSIWVVESDGGPARRVAASTTRSYGAPAWSPDGTAIVFVARPGLDADSQAQLAVVEPGGGDVRLITTPGTDRYDDHPTWTPDGARIVFAERRYDEREGPPNRLMSVKPDGSDRQLLLDDWSGRATPSIRVTQRPVSAETAATDPTGHPPLTSTYRVEGPVADGGARTEQTSVGSTAAPPDGRHRMPGRVTTANARSQDRPPRPAAVLAATFAILVALVIRHRALRTSSPLRRPQASPRSVREEVLVGGTRSEGGGDRA